jgi:hypothetical protein
MKDLPCYHKINGDSIFYKCDGVLTSDDEFRVMRKKFFGDLNVCIKNYETCYTKLPEITKILPDDVWRIFVDSKNRNSEGYWTMIRPPKSPGTKLRPT